MPHLNIEDLRSHDDFRAGRFETLASALGLTADEFVRECIDAGIKQRLMLPETTTKLEDYAQKINRVTANLGKLRDAYKADDK